MSENGFFDYKSFADANIDKRVSSIDYIHILFQAGPIPVDLADCFADLFWPEFVIVDGRVFVANMYDANHYQQYLNDGLKLDDIQFWSNLLEITGIFDDMTLSNAACFAEKIVKCWNARINQEFPEALGRARVINDIEAGEVFVVIGFPTNNCDSQQS